MNANNGTTTSKMAIACFQAIATDAIRNHFDPEQDDPLYQSSIEEICDEVYIRGVNQKEVAVGPRMRALYVPDGLRFQGKEALEEHVRVAVTVAVIEWMAETNDMTWLLDEVGTVGGKIAAWTRQEVA